MTLYRDLPKGAEFRFENQQEIYIKLGRPSRAHRADVSPQRGFSLKGNPVVFPVSKIVPDHVESGSKEHLDALCSFFGI